MRVLIVGAGGVGGYIGAKLVKDTDCEVVMVARGEHLEVSSDIGMEVMEDDFSWRVPPSHFTKSPDGMGIFDLVLVTVKSVSLNESISMIFNNINDKSTIIPIMNGVGNSEYIKKYYKECSVLDSCIYIISNIEQAGVVTKRGELLKHWWGEEEFDIEKYTHISSLIDEPGFRHRPTSDIESMLWRKFLYISPMAAMTSSYGESMDTIYEKRRDELRRCMEEVLSLAHAKGVRVGEEDVASVMKQASLVKRGSKTSMQLDFERGAPTELESLVGYVVSESEKRALPVPVMASLYEKLKRRES
jgi:2-dehydropantoate 2-reductase